MIWTIMLIFLSLIVSIVPAGALAYAAARTVRGFGTEANDMTMTLFAVVFASVYVACAYVLIGWVVG